MYSYLSNELVWALRREREEEARSIRPHTEKRVQTERSAPPRHDDGQWIAIALRGGTAGCR